MTNSQNGWPANKNKSAIGVVDFEVAGVKFPNGVKGGDVHTVLEYVATQFSKTVERLLVGGCWGYDYKGIEGSSTAISNHASGTAIDINAPHHPMGSTGTFGAKGKTAIHKIIDYCDEVVRWGGDYHDRKDEMHFEIIGNAAAVGKLAAKIKGTSSSTPPAETKLSVDGQLGPNTIKRWQQVMGTGADGVISDPSDLVKAVQTKLNSHGATLSVDGEGIAQDGKPTKTIAALQKYLGTPVDGKMSTPVSDVVKALQTSLNNGGF